MEPSSSAPFKRARPPGNRNQVPSCLVDGCTADLSQCRDYHRRHKVCEVHSKTPKVIIRGQEQRFCQQCSRFHCLVEFDEGKRSCRKRLDGHNRRRRKPQPQPQPHSLSVNPGRCLSNLQGSRHLPSSSPQIFATTAITSSWLGTAKMEPDIGSESSRNGFFRGSFPHSYKREEQLSLLQTNHSSLHGVSVYQLPLLSNGVGSSQKMFSNAIDSDRALSLLSSQPAETREIGLKPMVLSGPTSSLIPNMQYNGVAMEGEHVLATDGNDNTNIYGQEMFGSANGTSQRLSFS